MEGLKLKIGVCGIALFMLSSGGCVTTSSTSDTSVSTSEPNEIKITNPNQSLEYYIGQLPGVFVDNTRNGALIRGISTFSGDTRALFVLDGRRVGRSLSGIKSRVNMHDVRTIKVLKGPAASNYGLDSGNGVIEIKTK